MGATGGLVSRLRRPEYTGENRCLPCTVVNLAIAVSVSALGGVGLLWTVGPPAAAAAGLSLFCGAAVLIYLRGYLVPGTPELTKRYMPVWALRAFGKAPAAPDPGEIDPEAVLTSVGALEECPDGPDLCLSETFRSAWHEATDDVDEDASGRSRLLDVLGLDDGAVEIREFDRAFQAWIGDRRVGTWPSAAAFRADLGAATVLADRWGAWDDATIADRAHLLNGLRLFIDRCPACGAAPEFGTEAVESCCGSYDVAAVECPDCGARLFESGSIDGTAAVE